MHLSCNCLPSCLSDGTCSYEQQVLHVHAHILMFCSIDMHCIDIRIYPFGLIGDNLIEGWSRQHRREKVSEGAWLRISRLHFRGRWDALYTAQVVALRAIFN